MDYGKTIVITCTKCGKTLPTRTCDMEIDVFGHDCSSELDLKQPCFIGKIIMENPDFNQQVCDDFKRRKFEDKNKRIERGHFWNKSR